MFSVILLRWQDLETEDSLEPCYISEYRTLLVPIYSSISDLVDMLEDWVEQGTSAQNTTSTSTGNITSSITRNSFTYLSFSREGSMVEEPLPPGWDERRDNNGRVFYVDHNTRTTTFERPRQPEVDLNEEINQLSNTSTSSTGGFQTRRGISIEDDEQWSGGHVAIASPSLSSVPESEGLPPGWEARMSTEGVVFYMNHQLRVTQFERPVVEQATGAPTSEELEPWTDQDTTSRAPHIPERGEEPLPPHWTKKTTEQGRQFFINHVAKVTTWVDPRTGRESTVPSTARPPLVARQASTASLGPLPEGWEEKHYGNGKIFFVDHKNKRTTWEDPRFSDSSIAGKEVEYSRDYKYKYEMFMRHMNVYAGTDREKFEFTVRRNHLVDDSFAAIAKLKAPMTAKMRHRLWITFTGEQGLDYGGLSREWFSLLTTELFNPYHGLFEYSATDNYTLQINPNSGICNENHLSWFKFIGRVCGMAVFHKKLINAFFIRPFYSMMLGKTIQLSDMESVDIEFHNSLCHIRDNDPEDLCLTFEVDDDVFGEAVSRDLIPRGRDFAVVEENKMEYINLIVQWRFVQRVREQMAAFLHGFQEVIPAESIGVFDEGELELLLGGIGSINVRDWRDHTDYKNYSPEDAVIQWFWRLVLSFGDEMRSRLLQFVTGTSRVPMNGFAVSFQHFKP